VYDIQSGTPTRLTFDGAFNLMGAWTPDGKRVAFASTKAGTQSAFVQPADNSGAAEPLFTSEVVTTPASFSLDGKFVAYVEIRLATGYDIGVLSLSDHKPHPFLQTSAFERAPSFSPNGRWLAYVSDEFGRPEIFVRPYPGPGGKFQVSTDGGTEPV